MPLLVPIKLMPSSCSRALRQSAMWILTPCFVLGAAESHNLYAQSQPPAQSASESGQARTAPQPTLPEEAIAHQAPPGDVVIDDRKILSVYQSIGSVTPKDRAEKITERILAV